MRYFARNDLALVRALDLDQGPAFRHPVGRRREPTQAFFWTMNVSVDDEPVLFRRRSHNLVELLANAVFVLYTVARRDISFKFSMNSVHDGFSTHVASEARKRLDPERGRYDRRRH